MFSTALSRPGHAQATPTLDSEEWAFLTLINNYRAQNGVGPLQVSVDLENAAQWMSNDLATNNYFSHTDSLGRSPGTRLAAFGYNYGFWGENIAGGYSDAQDTFNQWQSACDPDASGNCTYAHRQNMLGSGYLVIGIGRAYSSSSTYGWYWTTDFGGYVDQVINPPSGSAPTIASFIATPSSITSGQSATLSWSVSGATTVTINNNIGTVASTGSQQVSPPQTAVYTLTAINSNGTNTAQATVTVAAPTGAPAAPALTSAVAKGATEIDLAWTAGTGGAAVTSFQILRNGAVVATVSATTLSYPDTGLSPATIYTYAIKALAAGGAYSTSNSLQATTAALTSPPPQTCPGPATNAFTGCYYSNMTLSGNPVLVRTDSQINFNWGFKTPDPAVPAGPFSVQWQGNFTFSSGAYTFTATTSDGMRIYIDGVQVLNRWYDQPGYIYSIRQNITQGTHLITVQYYENMDWAMASLTWQNNSPATQAPSILSFTANPSSITPGQTSTLSWSVNGASSLSLSGVGDVTGLTSKGVAPAQTTTYTLTASNSAGNSSAQVTVTLTSAPDTQPPTTPNLISATAVSSTEVDLTWSASTDNVGVAGYYILRNGSTLATVSAATLAYADKTVAPNSTYIYAVKAFDAAGNVSGPSNSIQVTTPGATQSTGTCPGPSSRAFTGCYYNDVTLSGNPALTETDSQINFDWGASSPGAGVGATNFSARWSGTFNFAAGTYSFVTNASDGIRLYIDGQLVIDEWKDQPVSMYEAALALSQGTHLVTVEYYAHTGWAACHLTWQAQ